MNLWENRHFGPMLLKQVEKPFNDKNYIYEMKFDGYRALIFASKNHLQILSRNHKDITYLYPELQSIQKLVKQNVIFDGEIICEDNGLPSYQMLQKRSHKKNKTQIKQEMIEHPVEYIAFDILYEGKDLTNLSLLKRKKILHKYQNTDVFIKAKYIEEYGKELFKEIQKRKIEGIVAKKKNGFYHINSRTDDFIKTKNLITETFCIGGYIENQSNTISLLLGEYIQNELHFVGKVLVSEKQEISKKLKETKPSKNGFIDYQEDAIYLTVKYKAKINYLERTKSGHLRHPVYVDYE